MGPVRYYFLIFLRRLPYFLIVATIVSAVSIALALTMPPTYMSQMRLIVDAPQIPSNLAPSTVTTSAPEQLQIIEQRLLTRPVLLEIAKKYEILPDQSEASEDQIIKAFGNQTSIRISAGRNAASLMTITFEAPTGEAAAGVLKEYLTEVQKLDVDYRKGRATGTLDFFQREVDRLGKELDKRSGRILQFKEENSDALPENLQFRQAQQGALQTNLEQLNQQIFSLTSQREKLMEVYNSTGQVAGIAGQNLTPAEQQLNLLRAQLSNDSVIYSESNPRIRLLQARVKKQEEVVAAEQNSNAAQPAAKTGSSALDIQLAQIDSQIDTLGDLKAVTEQRLAKVTATVQKTPANAIALAELQRNHDNIQLQYNSAVGNLARASTGERIETTSQGQQVAVIEEPSVPSAPFKPNRVMVAGGGTLFGIGLGLALILLLELLNRNPRRPEDLINKLDIFPIVTIPYVRSHGEIWVHRAIWTTVILTILVGVPLAVWTVHTYYQPLDPIAEKIMTKLEGLL